MVSPPLLNYGVRGKFFQKMLFMGAQILWKKIFGEVVLRGGFNDQIIPREKEFYKMHFLVIWTLKTWKFSPAMVEYSIENKALTILYNYERIYP